MTPRRLSTLVLAAILTLTLVTTNAGATTETVTSGTLSVRFTYHGDAPQSRSSRLVISQGGKTLYDQLVRSRWCGLQCAPNVIAGARTVVHIVRFQSAGPTVVVLDLYSGGAHCCSVEQVYWYNAAAITLGAH